MCERRQESEEADILVYRKNVTFLWFCLYITSRRFWLHFSCGVYSLPRSLTFYYTAYAKNLGRDGRTNKKRPGHTAQALHYIFTSALPSRKLRAEGKTPTSKNQHIKTPPAAMFYTIARAIAIAPGK